MYNESEQKFRANSSEFDWIINKQKNKELKKKQRIKKKIRVNFEKFKGNESELKKSAG